MMISTFASLTLVPVTASMRGIVDPKFVEALYSSFGSSKYQVPANLKEGNPNQS